MVSSMVNISGWDFPDNLRSFDSQISNTAEFWQSVVLQYLIPYRDYPILINSLIGLLNKAYCTSFIL